MSMMSEASNAQGCSFDCQTCNIPCNIRGTLFGNLPIVADTPAGLFLPHKFVTKVELLGRRTPRIIVSRKAYSQMWHIVNRARKEVSWLGVCRIIDDDILIEEVFLFQQICFNDKTVITPEGIAQRWQVFLKKYGTEFCNRIFFWGHSHVYMGTNPSVRDEEQMEKIFSQLGQPVFVRGILNKSGRMEFAIYLYKDRVKISDAEWTIQDLVDDSVKAEIEKDYLEMVREQEHIIVPEKGRKAYRERRRRRYL